MDAAPFISGVERQTTRFVASVDQAMGKGGGRSKQFRESATVSAGLGRRTRLLSAERCCDAIAAFPEKWSLSERQFSKVLGCGLR
jgi:hypothetical protein